MGRVRRNSAVRAMGQTVMGSSRWCAVAVLMAITAQRSAAGKFPSSPLEPGAGRPGAPRLPTSWHTPRSASCCSCSCSCSCSLPVPSRVHRAVDRTFGTGALRARG